MTDKEFDKFLKGKLEDYQPEYTQDSWKELEERIDKEVERPANDPFDDAVRAAMGRFAVPDSDGNWDKMEQLIIEDENASFDDNVRENVTNYEVPYDASTWPVLDEKIAADERFRKKLIGAKILEVAAILIALFTFYNFFPQIKNSFFDKDQPVPTEESVVTTQFAHVVASDRDATNDVAANKEELKAFGGVLTDGNLISGSASQLKLSPGHLDADGSREESSAIEEFDPKRAISMTNAEGRTDGPPNANMSESEARSSGEGEDLHNSIFVAPLTSTNLQSHQLEMQYSVEGVNPSASFENASTMTRSGDISTLAVLGLPKHMDTGISSAMPPIVITKKRKSLRFSLGASIDFNALYIPADQFYSNGSQISFSEKHLLASGYSAGAGLLFGDGAWNFETGLYYSSKTYEPNRIIKIGKTFDVRTVDFSEISLHIVSVPMYAHWNFDRKGKTRFYAVMGAAVNLIATANYDLITRNNFRSGPSGGAPDRRTDGEVARIREHILDGAEFSSKSYITLVGGFGVEHFLGDKMSIFAQPTYSYQVPFFQFSDQNGKQFQYLSMQLGTRVRLK